MARGNRPWWRRSCRPSDAPAGRRCWWNFTTSIAACRAGGAGLGQLRPPAVLVVDGYEQLAAGTVFCLGCSAGGAASGWWLRRIARRGCRSCIAARPTWNWPVRRWPNYSRGIRLSCAGRRLSIVWSGTGATCAKRCLICTTCTSGITRKVRGQSFKFAPISLSLNLRSSWQVLEFHNVLRHAGEPWLAGKAEAARRDWAERIIVSSGKLNQMRYC